MKELWKDIIGYEDLYQVSSKGRIRSKDRMIPFMNKYGFMSKYLKPGQNIKLNEVASPYLVVDLHNKRSVKRKYVHRLVAEAFIPNPHNKPVVNHIGYNKRNNNVNNLEWVTSSENTQYSIDHMRKPKKVVNTTTGHKYIGIRNNKYRVHIIIGSLNFQFDKQYDSLEEAIEVRNKILKQINIQLC